MSELFLFCFGFGKESSNKNAKATRPLLRQLWRSEGRIDQRFRGSDPQTSAFPCFSRLIEKRPPPPPPPRGASRARWPSTHARLELVPFF